MAPVGVVVATLLLWTRDDGFRLQVFHGADGKELALLYASGFLVGLMNLLAHVLTVLAIQVSKRWRRSLLFALRSWEDEEEEDEEEEEEEEKEKEKEEEKDPYAR